MGRRYVLRAGETLQAKPAWERALAIYREHLTPKLPEAETHSTIGGLLHNLGRVESDAGRHSEARALFVQAVEAQRRAFAKKPDPPRLARQSFVMLAMTDRELKQPERSAATCASVWRCGRRMRAACPRRRGNWRNVCR